VQWLQFDAYLGRLSWIACKAPAEHPKAPFGTQSPCQNSHFFNHSIRSTKKKIQIQSPRIDQIEASKKQTPDTSFLGDIISYLYQGLKNRYYIKNVHNLQSILKKINFFQNLKKNILNF
jgi:hypothetical protein